MKKLFTIVLFFILCSSAPAEQSNPDMEIIRREGHPTYLGSMQTAHDIWDDAGSMKVFFGDTSYGFVDMHILEVECNSVLFDELINGIKIYPSHFEAGSGMTVEQAVEIAGEYLPYNHLKANYSLSECFVVKPVDPEAKLKTVYAITYKRNDDVEQTSDTVYSLSNYHAITVEVSPDAGVTLIQLTQRLPRWMFQLKDHEYEKVILEDGFLTDQFPQ